MRNLFGGLSRTIFTSLILLTVATSVAFAADRFALAVGQHGDLLVFGSKGEKVADLPIPSIAQPVTVDATTSFQVSYGRDANDALTAILSPNTTNPSDLHFSVLGKSIDADKQAVVTLMFSSSLRHVSVDPGYVGVVQVNSEGMHRDSLNPSPIHTSAPMVTHSAPKPHHTLAPVAEEPVTQASSSAPTPRMNVNVEPRTAQNDTESLPSSVNVTEVSAADSATTTGSLYNNDPTKKLYWPEPVTAPDGSTPQVASDEMKLVCVHGDVTIKTPDGKTESGSNGTTVPNGSVVMTGDNSSAAVFIGGVSSARLMPNAGAQVTQQMSGTIRHTTVDLQKGAVFSRVGHRDGESEDYQVKTPQGVAAARGTQYATVYVDGVMYVFGKQGTIGISHLGKFIKNMIANGSSTIQIFITSSDHPFGKDLGQRMLEITLTSAQQFNIYTLKAIHDFIHGHLTPQDKKLLNDENVNIVWQGDTGITNGTLFGSTGDDTGGGSDNGNNGGQGNNDGNNGPPDNSQPPTTSLAGITPTPNMDP